MRKILGHSRDQRDLRSEIKRSGMSKSFEGLIKTNILIHEIHIHKAPYIFFLHICNDNKIVSVIIIIETPPKK